MQRFELSGDVESEATRGGSLFFVGTATTIIRFGGFTLLTDPNFLHQGERVHLGYGLPNRLAWRAEAGPHEPAPGS